MFKRTAIGLVALVLVTIFVAESANAIAIRLRRSVENFHECADGDPCFQATEVTDRLYGFDGVNAICEMEGRLFCDPLDNGEICSDAETNAALATASFSAAATFNVDTAENLTVLDDYTGQTACNQEYPARETVFRKFWPNQFIAHTIYSFDGGPRDGHDDYELIEKCFIQTDDPEYVCTPLWDSLSNGPRPHLPCCGESNTLTVDVIGSGTVTSEYNETTIINCGPNGSGDCNETFNGTSDPIDACPVLELTATPSLGYFVEWGGDCSGTDDCIVTPSAEVTAEFVGQPGIIKVSITGNTDGAKVWIKDPRGDFTEPPEFYCTGECILDTYLLPEGTTEITLKRKGGTWVGWGGVCEGVPNSEDQCTITLTGDFQEVIANFAP